MAANTLVSAYGAEAVTPSDSAGIPTTRAIYVGGAGTIVAVVNGTVVTFAGALAGTILKIRATRVNATGTVATGLVALY